MDYTEEDKRVLKIIDKEDFRNISKKNVLKLYSSLPNVSKEVAIKAIEQFPEFARTTIAIFKEYVSILTKLSEKYTDINQEAINAYLMPMRQYEIMLENDDLDFDQRMEVCRAMTELGNKINEVKREHTEGVLKIIGLATMGVTALGLGMINVLGGNASIDIKPPKL